MGDELLNYFHHELTFLRQMGAEFGGKYPKIARRLVLEEDKCEDPHVERLIEAFAFLTARIHRKLDDELPEVTGSLLSVLYPHYLAPVPSMSVVQFVLDSEQAKLQTGQTIPRDSMLSSRPVDGHPCRFRTCYPVTIWPVELVSARFEPLGRFTPHADTARTVLRLELRTLGDLPFSELHEKSLEGEDRVINRLRFYLQGEGQLVYGLYELVLNNALQLELRPGPGSQKKTSVPILLQPSCLRPLGFERHEGMLPYTDRSFMGYRLLQEYFTFPEKFLFFDLCGLERAARAGFGHTLEVLIYCNREFSLEKNVNAQTFRLNCTPIVNLFSQLAEPIRLTHTQTEYHVVPDVTRQTAAEVYSIDDVTGTAPRDERPIPFQPFYSVKHALERDLQHTFWHASRGQSQKKDDEGTEVYLTLVDLEFNAASPDVETVNVYTTCTNRDLPARLPFGNPEGDFQLEGAGLFSSIRCLKKPTPTLRPALRRGVQWGLISHLSLNHLSLLEREGGGGPEALQEILKLYDFADSSVTRRQIAGINHIAARRVFRPLSSALGSVFARGLEVSVEFDEQQYVGSGVFLFASVLERFLGLYASINSFSQLVASTRQREGLLKQWPPRAGEQIVL
jgi:type VI secretion system protein ImpG